MMKEFLKYFFGQGTEVEFENFTLAHILPILILVGVVILIYLFKDKIKLMKIFKYLAIIFFIITICVFTSCKKQQISSEDFTVTPSPININARIVLIFFSYLHAFILSLNR